MATWIKICSQPGLTAPLAGVEMVPDDPILSPTPHRSSNSTCRDILHDEPRPSDFADGVTASVQNMTNSDVKPLDRRNARKEAPRNKRATQEESRERSSTSEVATITGLISQQEDMLRLFEECEISRDHCMIPREAWTSAKRKGSFDPVISPRPSGNTLSYNQINCPFPLRPPQARASPHSQDVCGEDHNSDSSFLSDSLPTIPRVESTPIAKSDGIPTNLSNDRASVASPSSPTSRLRHKTSNLSQHSIGSSLRRISLPSPVSPPHDVHIPDTVAEGSDAQQLSPKEATFMPSNSVSEWLQWISNIK